MAERYRHIDYREISWDREPLKKTSEGFLTGEICLTGAGVFSYQQPDGSLLRVLRSMDEVLKSLDSLRMKVITRWHPDEDVIAENIQKYQVGNLGENITWDGLNAYAHAVIQAANAVADVESKVLRAVSCGYDCSRRMESGTWQGSDYDAVQYDIVYNHVALVDEGRAGDAVRLRLGDSAGTVNHKTRFGLGEIHEQNKEGDMAVELRETMLDGVKRQAEEPVLVALQKSRDNAQDLEKQLATVKAEKSALEGKIAALEEELKKAKEAEAGLGESAIVDRLELLDVSRKLELPTHDQAQKMLDVATLRKAVIKKIFPALVTDGKDNAYIMAVYDSARAQVQTSGGQHTQDSSYDGRPNPDGVQSARDRMNRQYFGEGDKK